jgi:hypothetical protein
VKLYQENFSLLINGYLKAIINNGLLTVDPCQDIVLLDSVCDFGLLLFAPFALGFYSIAQDIV